MSWVADVRCGLHSGFPRCCIRFFIRTWSKMSQEERLQYRTLHLGPNYVPCPDCIAAGNFVKVQPCPVGSHGGNVVERSEAHYERVDGKLVMTGAEFFYRDREGSYWVPAEHLAPI